VNRGVLGVVAVLPLVWAALHCSQRETAACTLVLSAFAAWGTWPGQAAFGSTPDESFLISTIFLISASVLALTLSADIAQRERVKVRLGFQEQNLRTLLSHADVGLAQIDRTGTFRLVNSRYCEIVRTPAAELLALQIHKLIDSDDLYHMRELLEQVVHTGKPFSIESKTRLPDGTRLWIRSNIAPMFDQSGCIQYLAAVAEDVTARRSAEENLILEHQTLQHTLNERTATLKKAREVLHAEMEQRVCELAATGLYDDEIARMLTAEGHRSPWRGAEVLPSTVRGIRLRHGMKTVRQRTRWPAVPGCLTVAQLAERLRIPQKWIHTQLRRGALRATHEPSGRYLFPDTEPAMQAVRELRERRTMHVDLTGASA